MPVCRVWPFTERFSEMIFNVIFHLREISGLDDNFICELLTYLGDGSDVLCRLAGRYGNTHVKMMQFMILK